MQLSETQKNVLVGLLLGDGSLEKRFGYRTPRLLVKQSYERKEYVKWLYRIFADITSIPAKQRTDTDQWYFATKNTPLFEEAWKKFYSKGTKTVPEDIVNIFQDPLSLAVWYMDDGTLDYREKYHYSFLLSTDCFTLSEVKRLQKTLDLSFQIKANIQRPSSRGKRYYKLYIGKEGRNRMCEIINPYILNCFSYKLPPL